MEHYENTDNLPFLLACKSLLTRVPQIDHQHKRYFRSIYWVGMNGSPLILSNSPFLTCQSRKFPNTMLDISPTR